MIITPNAPALNQFSRSIRAGFMLRVLSAWIAILLLMMPAEAQLNCDGAGSARCMARRDVAEARRSESSPTGGVPRAFGGSGPSTGASPPAEEAGRSPPVLSDQARTVSEIANQRGDRTFLMVDKAGGEIILFENGQAIYSSAALTGMSLGDYLPPGAINVPPSPNTSLNLKVTPAGRYTVSREHDPEYGTVFIINELQGKDWDIAIHRVFLGTPAEHRAERLRSASRDDRHIGFGCINVDPNTIGVLARHLTKIRKTPIYVLPQDLTRTMAIFAPR
jgi:hypothetical protein